MEPLVLIGAGSLLVLVALVLSLARPRPHEHLGAERSHAAEAEVEQTDIEQMIEARNAIRRRRGRPTLGDDLAQRLRSDLDRDP